MMLLDYFKNITNATLIILENDSTMSCKKNIILREYVCTPHYYTDLNYEFEVGILS